MGASIGMPVRLLSVLAVVCLATWVPLAASAQPIPSTEIASSGQPAPGTGATFSTVFGASINASGQLVFGASLAGAGVSEATDHAVFVGPAVPGAQQGVMREGQAAGPGVTVGDVTSIGPINGDGLAVFQARLRGGSEWAGVFAGRPGSLSKVYGLSGSDTVVGTPALAMGPRAVLTVDAGVVVWDGSSTTSAATPGRPFQPTINRSGRIVYGTFDAGYAGTPGDFRAFAQAGGPAPGAGAAATFEVIPAASQNDAGEVAFNGWALPAGGVTRLGGVWAGQPDDLRLVALDGAPAAGLPGHTYRQLLFDIDTPTLVPLSGDGRVGFAGAYADASGEVAGYAAWAGRPGEVRLLARQGDQFETPDGSVVTLNTVRHNGIWLNASGQAVLLGDSTLPGDPFLRATILAVDADGSVHLVAVADRFSHLGIGYGEGTGGQDGRPSPFNDAGQLVYTRQFFGGLSSVLLATVPEPSVLALGLSVAPALLARRRGGAPAVARGNAMNYARGRTRGTCPTWRLPGGG